MFEWLPLTTTVMGDAINKAGLPELGGAALVRLHLCCVE